MGTVRIIAGELKGRRVSVAAVAGLRPTPERVREALFSILGHDLSGLRVLDAFAGTGVLGLEALSRGASHVVFLEMRRDVASGIASVLTGLGLVERTRILVGPAVESLSRAASIGPFDLVLADPPYGSGEAARLLSALPDSGVLAPGARIVVERAASDAPAPAPRGSDLTMTRRYGRTALDFYRLGQEGSAEPSA